MSRTTPLRLPLLLGFSLALSGCNGTAPANTAPIPLLQSQSSSSSTVRNPVRPQSADPFMVFYNGNYYQTFTSVHSIKIVKASSVASLAEQPAQQVWQDANSSRNDNLWAPELYHFGGHWYLYYTGGPSTCCAGQRAHVLESSGDDPMGPYSYKARLFDPANDVFAIDGTVLQKANGSLYFLWSGNESSQNIYIAPMSNPWTLSGARVQLSAPTYAWEKSGKDVNEGPAVLQHAGRIFVTYSASACWTDDYKLGMLSTSDSSDLLNPASWSKSANPVLSSNAANLAYGPGHNGFFKSPDGGEDWIIYHANLVAGTGCGGLRNSRIQKVSWNGDGSPNFGTPVSPTTDLPLPSGDPGPQSVEGFAPSLASWGPNRLDLFVRGRDNALWHKSYSGSWSGWDSLGGIITAAPAATSQGVNNLDAFVRGMDDGLWRRSYQSGWGNFASQGSILLSGPTVTSSGPGSSDVFVRGSDDGVYQIHFSGSSQSGTSLGGIIAGTPAAVARGSRLDVVVHGLDNNLYHNIYTTGWSGWTSVPGSLSSSPTLTARGSSGLLDAFARGSDGSLVHNVYSGSWGNWESLGGVISSAPTAASWGSSRLDVVVRGTDGNYYHKFWDGSSWSGFTSIGAP